MKYCYIKQQFIHVNRILLFVFLFTVTVSAQWLNNGGIKTNILSVTPQSTKVEYVFTNYGERTINVNGTECVYYEIPGSIFLMEKGMPQLPSDRRSIVIPDLAATNYSIIDAEYETKETLPVMPSKGHFTRNIDPDSVPFEFDEFYSTNDWYPSENILLDVPYIIRDLRGQTIQFNPMQYNPAGGKLKICKRIVVEVFNDPNGQAVNPFVRTSPLIKVNKEFDAVYQSLFINYGMGEYDYTPLEETGRLLIIYPTAFASNITPFFNWKVERGIQTLLAEYPTQTGSGSAAIKTYIQNLYNSPDGLTFIILVGEASQIPTLYGQYESAPSDPCYVKLAGSDAYPDAFISRISPSSSTNLDYVLWKLIKYEKYPDTGPDAAWYLKGTGVASNEGSPPDWQRANWLRDMLINDMYFTQVDQIYDPSATASQVTTALNDGRSVLNYIGHGSGTSWGTTGFSNSHIHQLSNGYKNPFIIDVACQNGNFTMNECMEEAWIRTGDMNNPRGAISVYGASTNASWVPPCDMQNHAMMLLTTRQKQTAGGICFNGLMHAMDLWGGSTGEGLKLMEQYNIMGDCTTLLTMGVEPDTTAPEQITDLTAIDPTSNSVTLNWTAPLDSSFLGIVSYDLRYSTTPIVTNYDFENAPQVLIAGGPDTSGTPKSYILNNLNYSTTYFFAIKALDIWGNKSVMSNVPIMLTWGAPVISVTPDSMYCLMLPNTTHTDSVMISNISSGNSTLDYQIELTNNTFPGAIITRVVQVSEVNTEPFTKENPDMSKGTGIRGGGGPDLFGYEWIDSNEPEGPVYEWNDISTTGTLVDNWVATSIYPAVDEGKAGPFQLGFNFKYYGIDYSNVWFSSNGFVSFIDITDAGMSNSTIPSSGIPNCMIAGIWDDLDGKTTGKVYYKQEQNKFIVQYDNWPGYSTGVGPFTFQFVLNKNGKIMLYYKTISGSSSSSTVGIENHNGTDGLQVAYNATYLQNNLALQFSAEPEWLIAENIEGTVYNGNSIAVLLNFLTEGIDSGDYSMDMVISSNDPVNSEIIIPIAMKISNVVPVELSYFTAEN
ncbi:MAG: C25 family cysteine peptidase, partial [Ignavibacteriaceae bacterium]